MDFPLTHSVSFFLYIYIYNCRQSECFGLLGLISAVQTWERLTQMRTFMPSLVLHACGRENTMPCQSAQTTEVASFAQLPATRHPQVECSTNSGCRDPNVGYICPRR